MYKTLSGLSFIVRAYLCYLTIDTIPIMKDEFLNTVLLETVSFYTILLLITYGEVSLFFTKGEGAILGTIFYFIIYVINVGIMYAIMNMLTYIGILPI